ncbi:uncharacterized protein LOC134841642 [Symsagittifera roscoffensis]|uniref:uncharacterized protein LOC134841642 n=1 Tax=Symsagittifera roscoffensis TaxID=84072 RepID=UPI00307C3359
MDNFYESTDSISEAQRIFNDLRYFLQTGSFNLTKWITTNNDILASIHEEHRDISFDELLDKTTTKRVLGIQWDIASDSLVFWPNNFYDLLKKKRTQWNLLHTSSSVFDPIGIAAPFTIPLRILQRSVWRQGLSWDDPLSNGNLPEFFTLLSEINQLQVVSIPRQYFFHKYSKLSLHVFSDASYAALALVAYIVYIEEITNQRSISLALGKARVAPLKQHAITKLELQAALIGSRLVKFIKTHSSKFIKTPAYLFTDSSTVLQRIHGPDKRQQIFVANRVGEILDLPLASQWKYCPGNLNPADDGTR